MKQRGIGIVGAQETHTAHNSKEKRKDYTWYLNGNENGETGMAFIIRNDIHKYIIDIAPLSPRLVELKLAGTIPITIVNAYTSRKPVARKREILPGRPRDYSEN